MYPERRAGITPDRRDGSPARSAPQVIESSHLLRRSALPSETTQRTQAVEITDRHGAPLRFEVRRPAEEHPAVPVLIILAGLKTGHRSLDHLPPCGANALVAYAYPYDREHWRTQSILGRGITVWRMAARVADQVAALLAWVRRQAWCDPERVSLCGGSLGAILLPMILRELQSRGMEVRCAIFAYGGAGRFSLAWLSLRHRSVGLALIAALLALAFLRNIEPARHLPCLEGDFLVISSPDDERVPQRCAARFEALLPEPKHIVHLAGEHLDTQRPDLLASVVDIAKRWLHERDAFNP